MESLVKCKAQRRAVVAFSVDFENRLVRNYYGVNSNDNHGLQSISTRSVLRKSQLHMSSQFFTSFSYSGTL